MNILASANASEGEGGLLDRDVGWVRLVEGDGGGWQTERERGRTDEEGEGDVVYGWALALGWEGIIGSDRKLGQGLGKIQVGLHGIGWVCEWECHREQGR